MRPRLIAVMVCYIALALLAAFTLDRLLRIAVWIFLGGLAVKTLIANSARR